MTLITLINTKLVLHQREMQNMRTIFLVIVLLFNAQNTLAQICIIPDAHHYISDTVEPFFCNNIPDSFRLEYYMKDKGSRYTTITDSVSSTYIARLRTAKSSAKKRRKEYHVQVAHYGNDGLIDSNIIRSMVYSNPITGYFTKESKHVQYRYKQTTNHLLLERNIASVDSLYQEDKFIEETTSQSSTKYYFGMDSLLFKKEESGITKTHPKHTTVPNYVIVTSYVYSDNRLDRISKMSYKDFENLDTPFIQDIIQYDLLVQNGDTQIYKKSRRRLFLNDDHSGYDSVNMIVTRDFKPLVYELFVRKEGAMEYYGMYDSTTNRDGLMYIDTLLSWQKKSIGNSLVLFKNSALGHSSLTINNQRKGCTIYTPLTVGAVEQTYKYRLKKLNRKNALKISLISPASTEYNISHIQLFNCRNKQYLKYEYSTGAVLP